MARVLLCDDSNLILTLFERGMARAGHQVVAKARDGDECLKLFDEQRPDLVLLDITMPNKDGRECLMELLKRHPRACVVMVSAVLNDDVKTECLRLGARGFIEKRSVRTPEEFELNVLSIVTPILQAV